MRLKFYLKGIKILRKGMDITYEGETWKECCEECLKSYSHRTLKKITMENQIGEMEDAPEEVFSYYKKWQSELKMISTYQHEEYLRHLREVTIGERVNWQKNALNRVENQPIEEVKEKARRWVYEWGEKYEFETWSDWSDEEKWEHVLRLRYLIDEKFDDQKYWIDYANSKRKHGGERGSNYTLEKALNEWHEMKKYWDFFTAYTVISLLALFGYFIKSISEI